MGRCIVKQPNGQLAVFSTIVDDFVAQDATWDDYIAWRVEEATREILRDVARFKRDIEARGSTSGVGRTWETCLRTIEELHGAETASERRAVGEAPVRATD